MGAKESDHGLQLHSMDAARIFKKLDTYGEQFASVQKSMDDMNEKFVHIIRLEERLTSYAEVLGRYGQRIDDHDSRLRKAEMQLVETKFSIASPERLDSITQDVKNLSDRLEEVMKSSDFNSGRDQFIGKVAMWAFSIAGGILVWFFTNKG